MANFPGQKQITYSQRLPSGRAAAAYRESTADEYRALAGLGEAVFQIGAEQQRQEQALQYSQGMRQINEKINDAMNSITGNEESDKKLWEDLAADIETVQYKSPMVNRNLQIYVNRIAPTVQEGVSNQFQKVRQQNFIDEAKIEAQTRLAKGDLDEYYVLQDNLYQSKAISETEWKYNKKMAPLNSALEQTRDLIASDRGKDIEKGIFALEHIQEFARANGLEMTTEQKEYGNKLLSIANQNRTGQYDESNKQLTDLMIDGSLSTEEVQKRRNELSETDYQQWAKIAMNPVDKRGNIIQTTELKTKAMDVWRGTLSRTQLESEIRASLADPLGINETQYAEIYDDLNREVKAFQAQDKKTYSIEAAQAILGKDAKGLTFDALGNIAFDTGRMESPQDVIDRKMLFIDLYNKEMMDFLAANPKASKQEFYAAHQQAKLTYKIAAKDPNTPTPEALRKINTRESYEQGKKLGYWE